MNRQRNINEARSLLADIEVGEEDIEAKRWRVAQLAAEAVADGMSKREYGREIGKSDSTVREWVGAWERWGTRDGARHGARPRFADATATVKAGADEIVTKADQRRREIERREPTRHDDRVEMAKKLLADPKVAKAAAVTITDPTTKAGRLISQEVLTQEAQLRRKHREQAAQARADGAMPLPAYMAKMVVKINEFSLGLSGFTDEDIDELPDGRGRELVTAAARNLAVQAQRWVDRLERKPDLRVIEGDLLHKEMAAAK